jgi:multiple sugar transport system substrate-binding protein
MLKKKSLLTLSIIIIMIFSSSVFALAAQKEISLWTAYDTNVPTYIKLANEYMKDHPDVKINIEAFPARAMEQKVAVTLPAGTASDIIEESPFAMAPYVSVGLINRPPVWLDDFVEESVYDLMKPGVGIDGVLWGAPSFVGLKYLYCNKDMMDEVGLVDAPQTIDQMIEYAKKMTKYDNKGNITRSGISLRLSGGGYGVAEKWWMLALAPYGGSPLIETAPGKYAGGFDTEECQKAIQLFLDLLYKHRVDSYNLDHDVEAFVREGTAMFQREGFVIDQLANQAPDINYIVAPLPGDLYRKTMCVNINFWVPEASKHKDEAWDFIKFLMSKENVLMKFKETGWNPVRKDVDYSSAYAKHPMYAYLQYFPDEYNAYFYYTIRPWNEIWTKAGEWLTELFASESLANNPEKIAEECKQFNKTVNDILDEFDLYAPVQ